MADYSQYVGISRHEVIDGLFNKFATELFLHHPGLSQVVVKERIINTRLAMYSKMLRKKDMIAQYFCPYTLELLRNVHMQKFKIVLATMSHFQEANGIIKMLGIGDSLDLILTREDVKQGKPDPEIYLKAKDLLGIRAEECLVIEDSVNGIIAGINACMIVFAVTNEITRKSVHSLDLEGRAFLVDDLQELNNRVFNFINSAL
jgi:HAD superfamily hydrolase (TIGR01509 family)